MEANLKLNIGTPEQPVQHERKVLLEFVLHEHIQGFLNDMASCAKPQFVWSVMRKHAGANPRPATGADLTADKDVKQTYGSRTQQGAKPNCGPSPLPHEVLTQPTQTSVLLPSTPCSSSVTHTTSHIQLRCIHDKLGGSMSKPLSLAAGLTVLLRHS